MKPFPIVFIMCLFTINSFCQSPLEKLVKLKLYDDGGYIIPEKVSYAHFDESIDLKLSSKDTMIYGRQIKIISFTDQGIENASNFFSMRWNPQLEEVVLLVDMTTLKTYRIYGWRMNDISSLLFDFEQIAYKNYYTFRKKKFLEMLSTDSRDLWCTWKSILNRKKTLCTLNYADPVRSQGYPER